MGQIVAETGYLLIDACGLAICMVAMEPRATFFLSSMSDSMSDTYIALGMYATVAIAVAAFATFEVMLYGFTAVSISFLQVRQTFIHSL